MCYDNAISEEARAANWTILTANLTYLSKVNQGFATDFALLRSVRPQVKVPVSLQKRPINRLSSTEADL